MEFSDAIPFLQQEHSAVIVTQRLSGAAQTTIVKAGPYEGKMAFVVRGDTIKKRNLERNPRCTVLTARPDWGRYCSVEGVAALRGPDNTEADELRLLLRAVFKAAGGTHSDWDAFDHVMREERRVVVLVTPDRVYGRI